MTQVELCTRVGVSRKLICEIIKGKAHVSPETGVRLELALGSPRGFWSRLQSRHFEQLARRRHTEALSGQLGWLRELPVRAMIDARWIEERGCELEQAQTLLEWFRTHHGAAWD